MRKVVFLIVLLILGIGISPCFAETNTPPTGYTDLAKYQNGLFYAMGWAADKEDGAPLKKVQVYVDDKSVGIAKLGLSRPGLGAAAKNQSWDKGGWEFYTKIPLTKGIHAAYMTTTDKQGAPFKSNVMKFEVK